MYATLLRARKEFGFSVVVRSRFAITSREREREEGGRKKEKVPHKVRLIYLLSKAATGIDLRWLFLSYGNIQTAMEPL